MRGVWYVTIVMLQLLWYSTKGSACWVIDHIHWQSTAPCVISDQLERSALCTASDYNNVGTYYYASKCGYVYSIGYRVHAKLAWVCVGETQACVSECVRVCVKCSSIPEVPTSFWTTRTCLQQRMAIWIIRMCWLGFLCYMYRGVFVGVRAGVRASIREAGLSRRRCWYLADWAWWRAASQWLPLKSALGDKNSGNAYYITIQSF